VSALAVDASVAVKWLLPEVHGDAALRTLEHHHPLLVPDLLFAEVGNVLWKRVRRREATIEEARTAVSTLRALPLSVYPSQSLIEPALEIAHRTGRSVYDSLYVALAVWHRHPLVTADRRLYDALRRGPFAAELVWVEDVT
jgi:predicted nucleic acid-binding protein